MQPNRAISTLLMLGRLGLAGLFLYTGATKALDPGLLAQDIANYRVLPEALVGPTALLLPALELAAAAGLLLRSYAGGAALLTGLMLLAFAGAMGQARLRGIDLDCGCFGTAASSAVSWNKVALNLGLAMLSFWIVRSQLVTNASPGPVPEKP